MKILEADFVLTCNEEFEIIRKGAVAFEATIVEVGESEHLKAKYPNATHIFTPPHSIIMPGLINAHVHLEFSANATMLHYGDFIPWLQSVIKHREYLSQMATTELIAEKLQLMLRSGTTSLGAISSFGADLEACAQTAQRVVFFNEVLGSNPGTVDAMYGDFLGRYHQSKDEASSTFFPAIAIHSPYSTHPILAKKAIELSFADQTPLSTHFMESLAEREWIDEGKGDFTQFLTAFNPYAKPMCSASEFLELFNSTPALFTHGVHASDKEYAHMASCHGTLTHCPMSNRLLGVGKLDLEAINRHAINLTLGTDGLSSNISLSLWDEMRSALMMHTQSPLDSLSKLLLKAVTSNPAHALNLPSGKLEKGLWADIVVATLPQEVENLEQVPTQLILHTHQTHFNFINGELVC